MIKLNLAAMRDFAANINKNKENVSKNTVNKRASKSDEK